jgi:WD40 repeat protein
VGADRARDSAESALDQAETYDYFHRIGLAEREWWANNVGRARELLDECPLDRRDWEWHYLKRLCHLELRTIRGHTDLVVTVAYCPDGDHVASGGQDGTVRIWNRETGREVRALANHFQGVSSIAFSPDGRILASGTVDFVNYEPGEVKLWDWRTGQELLTLKADERVLDVAFSPGGKARLATANGNGNVNVWEIEDTQGGVTVSKEPLTLSHSDSVESISFSPDGRYLACATGISYINVSAKPGDVVVWDLTSASKYATLRGHEAAVASVEFSPDGTRIASGSYDRTIKLWDFATKQEIHTLRGHAHFVGTVAFSPQGNRIASASEDGSVKVWNVDSGRELFTIRGHVGPVEGVAFSLDGKELASGNENGVKLWDSSGAPVMNVLHDSTGGFTNVAFTGEEILTLRGHNGPVFGVAFSPVGHRLATASMDGTIGLWDATPLSNKHEE